MQIALARFIVNWAPQPVAIDVTRFLAARTQRPPVSLVEQEAMLHATRMHYGNNRQSAAWVWGSGPPVVFVHGWSGRAAQMAPLARHISASGFRSVAIEITGHGDSPQRHTRWDYFLRDVSVLADALGEEVHAYVGHSAGALAMMAARSLKGIQARRYVCICAPSYPFPPISVIQKKLDPGPGVLDSYREYIAGQFETNWVALQAGRSYAGASADTLLFYDQTDRFVDHSEGDRLKDLCPGARLVKTNRYGHLAILSAPELAQATSAFLQPPHVD